MRLQITVCSLKGYRKASGDTYVKIKDGGKKYKTRVVENSLAPQWNETFVLELEGKKPLLLEVYDHNTWSSNECIGRTHLVYKDLVRGKPDDVWHQLKTEDGVDSEVSIRIAMLAIDFGATAPPPEPEPASVSPPPPAPPPQAPAPPPPAPAPAPPSDPYKDLLVALLAQWRGTRTAPGDVLALARLLYAAQDKLKVVEASTTLPPATTLDKILRASFKRYDLDDTDHLSTSEELLLLCTNLSFKMRLKLSEQELESVCSSCVAGGAPVESWSFPVFSTWFKAIFLHGILTMPPPEPQAAPEQPKVVRALVKPQQKPKPQVDWQKKLDQAAATNQAELNDANSKLQQAIRLRDQQISELRDQLRNSPGPRQRAGSVAASSELIWLHEALNDDLDNEGDGAADLMGEWYARLRQSGTFLFHPLLLHAGYNSFILQDSKAVLWGRLVFTCERDIETAPEQLKLAVKCHASWGAPGSAQAREELSGHFDLVQGLVTLERDSLQDAGGLLAETKSGYRLMLNCDGRGFLGLTKAADGSGFRRLMIGQTTELSHSGSDELVRCALVNRTHHVDVVHDGGAVGVDREQATAPWTVATCDPVGPHHVPGAVPLTIQDHEQFAMLAHQHAELVMAPRSAGEAEQIWELTPAGQLINQSSGQMLCFDGNALGLEQFDDSNENQSTEGKEWDLCMAITGVESLVKSIAMRYIGFVVKNFQGVEVILRAVVYVEAYPSDPNHGTASIKGTIDWTVQRVIQIDSSQESADLAADLEEHMERFDMATHKFEGAFLYGQSVADLRLVEINDEQRVLSAISPCCSAAKNGQLVLSHDATQCAVIIADEAAEVVEVIRSHAMHDRSVVLRPLESAGVQGASNALPSLSPVQEPDHDGAATLDKAGFVTWTYHVHSSCTEARLCAASVEGGQKVELRVGGAEGLLVGTHEIEATGALDLFSTQVFEIAMPADNLDETITLCFENSAGGAGASSSFSLEWLALHTKATGEELQLLQRVEHHKQATAAALDASNYHMGQVDAAGCTAENAEAALARRAAGDAKKQAKLAKQEHRQAEEMSQQLPGLLLMRMASFAENSLELQLLMIEHGTLCEVGRKARAVVEQRQLEFAQRMREEEAARMLYLEAIKGRREACEKMVMLEQLATNQADATAKARTELERESLPLEVLVEDHHETAERHRDQADSARNEAAVVAHDAAQLAIKKGRLETEDKARKAAARAAEAMARETEQMLLEEELSDDDENDYKDSKPTMMLFHGGKPVHTVINVDDSEKIGDDFNHYIKASNDDNSGDVEHIKEVAVTMQKQERRDMTAISNNTPNNVKDKLGSAFQGLR